jgi:Uma2 family endonuclease
MTLLDPILRSPAAVTLAGQLNAKLSDEARRRAEFHDWLTDSVKAEFINGEVTVHSPVRFSHQRVSFRAAKLLDAYASVRQLGVVGHEKLLIHLTRNDYEPDVCWWGPEKSSAFQPNTMFFPPPDLVVEVLSRSTEANDRGVKFEDYAAHGISEYWLIDPDSQTLEQYVLAAGAYQLKPSTPTPTPTPTLTPVLTSPLIGGLSLPLQAFFDDAANLNALRAASPPSTP